GWEESTLRSGPSRPGGYAILSHHARGHSLENGALAARRLLRRRARDLPSDALAQPGRRRSAQPARPRLAPGGRRAVDPGRQSAVDRRQFAGRVHQPDRRPAAARLARSPRADGRDPPAPPRGVRSARPDRPPGLGREGAPAARPPLVAEPVAALQLGFPLEPQLPVPLRTAPPLGDPAPARAAGPARLRGPRRRHGPRVRAPPFGAPPDRLRRSPLAPPLVPHPLGRGGARRPGRRGHPRALGRGGRPATGDRGGAQGIPRARAALRLPSPPRR